MRIGFDARMIDHPGIGRYINNLLGAMMDMAGDSEFILYGDLNKLAGFKNCRKKEYTLPVYSFKENFSNPFARDGLDVAHIPHFNASLRNIKNLVITIHDLIYLKFPESRPDLIKGIAVRPAISMAIRRADKIIAVSENTKRDIIKEFPDAEGKVEVVYEAADLCFEKITDIKRLSPIKEKHNLPDKFILFVGSLKKHKNIERLIDAYTDLKSKGIQHKLVIVGRYRPREQEILKKIKSTDALYIGEIPTEDLVVIYNLASLLVIPSLYEGFGLPVLEAMSCGVPVATSYAASLPEVVGDAGVLFNPEDISSISNKIYEVLEDENLRQKLIEKGLKRTSNFSWEKAARQTIELYKKP